MSAPLSGLRAWLVQRLSAVYLAGFFTYLIVHFAFFPPRSHAEWLAWLRDPLISLAWGLFFLALLVHAWIGVRDVLLDYARFFALRLALLSLAGVGLLACGLWAMRLLFGALP